MSIAITCEECGQQMDEDDMICRACYDKEIAELEGEIDTLQDTITDQANRIVELEGEATDYENRISEMEAEK